MREGDNPVSNGVCVQVNVGAREIRVSDGHVCAIEGVQDAAHRVESGRTCIC